MRAHLKNNIGSVSTATMRSEDLIPAFIDALRAQKPLHRKHRALIRDIESRMGKPGYYDSEDAAYDLNESLFDALDEYAMPYMYFGSHPSDGSDYGFWLAEYFEDEFDGLKVNDISQVPRGYTGEVLHVNDHGNVTLYAYSRGRGWEVWTFV